MILKSLIKDKSRVCFDCCKAMIGAGDVIEIADSFYVDAEVQGAIKLGMVELVGEPPAATIEAAQPKPDKKLKNVWKTAIAIDCVRGHVPAGGYITIPIDKFRSSEVQGAIAMGMLVDEDAPYVPRISTGPVELEELSTSDILPAAGEQPVGPAKPAAVANTQRQRRPAPKAAPKAAPVKARKLSRSNEESGDDSGDDMYRPSQIIDQPVRSRKAAQAPADGEESMIIEPATPAPVPAQPATPPSVERKAPIMDIGASNTEEEGNPLGFLEIFNNDDDGR